MRLFMYISMEEIKADFNTQTSCNVAWCQCETVGTCHGSAHHIYRLFIHMGSYRHAYLVTVKSMQGNEAKVAMGNLVWWLLCDTSDGAVCMTCRYFQWQTWVTFARVYSGLSTSFREKRRKRERERDGGGIMGWVRSAIRHYVFHFQLGYKLCCSPEPRPH